MSTFEPAGRVPVPPGKRRPNGPVQVRGRSQSTSPTTGCVDDSPARRRYPAPVPVVRRLLAQRNLAVLICAAALLLKLLVPTGYMVASQHGRMTITICTGTAPRSMTIEMPGMGSEMPDHGKKDGGNGEMPCAFSGLSAPSLGAVDPIQLAALLTFIVAIGLVGVLLPAPCAPARLRPPLRGPPEYP